MPIAEQSVYAALRQVYDPELLVNIVDLGLIYEVEVTEDVAEEAVSEGMVLGGERADVGVAENDEREAAEDEHASECHDECRYADVGDPEALPHSDERTDDGEVSWQLARDIVDAAPVRGTQEPQRHARKCAGEDVRSW